MKQFHFSIIIRNTLYEIFKPIVMRIPWNCVRVFGFKLFQLKTGKHVFIARKIDIRAPWYIEMGNNVIINRNAILDGRGGLKIGNNVDVAQDTYIWTAQHDYNDDYHAYIQAPVIIGDYVWLSSRATILPGVTIGDGAVVAAGAVVTRNVDTMQVVGGIPAKKIADRKSGLKYILKK